MKRCPTKAWTPQGKTMLVKVYMKNLGGENLLLWYIFIDKKGDFWDMEWALLI